MPKTTWRTLSRRRRRLVIAAGVLVVLVAAGTVGVSNFLAPPSTPPDYTGPRPEPAEDGYLSHTESIEVNVPKTEFMAWVGDPDVSLDELIQSDGSDGFPTVVGTEIIWGDWDAESDRTGDRRRVDFDDGHHLAEEVLVDDGELFRYMIWGFTNYQRLAVRYAVAEFHFTEKGETTEITWTYSFQPTTGLLRSFIADFVADTMAPMMRDTLAGMKTGAEAA